MINILIVSNNHLDRDRILDLIREIFRKIPHPPFTIDDASSAEEAIGMLSTESIALLITDYNLPELDGLELIRQISRPSMKKVLITKDPPSVEMRVDAAAAGVDWIIQAPLSKEKLGEVIRIVIRSERGNP